MKYKMIVKTTVFPRSLVNFWDTQYYFFYTIPRNVLLKVVSFVTKGSTVNLASSYRIAKGSGRSNIKEENITNIKGNSSPK